jgi:hypothetical protein
MAFQLESCGEGLTGQSPFQKPDIADEHMRIVATPMVE